MRCVYNKTANISVARLDICNDSDAPSRDFLVLGVAVSNLCRCLVLSCLITMTSVGTWLLLGPGEVASLLIPGYRVRQHLARSSRSHLFDCENGWMVCSSSVEQSLSSV